jgi:hypothetical protein
MGAVARRRSRARSEGWRYRQRQEIIPHAIEGERKDRNVMLPVDFELLREWWMRPPVRTGCVAPEHLDVFPSYRGKPFQRGFRGSSKKCARSWISQTSHAAPHCAMVRHPPAGTRVDIASFQRALLGQPN